METKNIINRPKKSIKTIKTTKLTKNTPNEIQTAKNTKQKKPKKKQRDEKYNINNNRGKNEEFTEAWSQMPVNHDESQVDAV